MKNKFSKKFGIILVIELLIIFGAVFYYVSSLKPSQIYPLSGMSILENDFVFEIKNGNLILIDKTPDFNNAIKLNQNSDITLPPGTYYWKVKGKYGESEIRNFTIKEVVGMNIVNNSDVYELWNTGNTELNITKKTGTYISKIILDTDEIKELKFDNSTYIGEKNE